MVYSNIPFSSRFRGGRVPFHVFRVSSFFTEVAVGPRDCGWGVLIIEEVDGVGDKLKSHNHYAVHTGCYTGRHFWTCHVFLNCRSIRVSGVSAARLKELYLDDIIFHRKTRGKDTTGILRYSAAQLVLFRNCALVICLTSHRNVTQLNYFLCACICIYRHYRALTDGRAQSVGTSSWLALCRFEWGLPHFLQLGYGTVLSMLWGCCWGSVGHNYCHKESEAWKYARHIASVKVHRKSLSFICNEWMSGVKMPVV